MYVIDSYLDLRVKFLYGTVALFLHFQEFMLFNLVIN